RLRRNVHAVASILVLSRNGPDDHQRVGILEGQGTKERGVDQTEDDGIRADTECERQRGGDGEARPLDQHSKAIQDVLPEGSHASTSPNQPRKRPDVCRRLNRRLRWGQSSIESREETR